MFLRILQTRRYTVWSLSRDALCLMFLLVLDIISYLSIVGTSERDLYQCPHMKDESRGYTWCVKIFERPDDPDEQVMQRHDTREKSSRRTHGMKCCREKNTVLDL